MADKLYRTAVVIGNTLAGLVAAQTLTDFFERVTLLELETDGDDASNVAEGQLHDDLLTHPQIRIIQAREPVVILLHASGTFAIGVRYCAADEPLQVTTATPSLSERAVIADLIVDGRSAVSGSTSAEGLILLRDAPAHKIDTALRNALTPQQNAPRAHTLEDVAARFEHHLRRQVIQ